MFTVKKTSRGAPVAGCLVSFVCHTVQRYLRTSHIPKCFHWVSILLFIKHRATGPVGGRHKADASDLRCCRLNSCQAAFSGPLPFTLTADGLQGNMSAGHSLLCIKMQLSAKGRKWNAAQWFAARGALKCNKASWDDWWNDLVEF